MTLIQRGSRGQLVTQIQSRLLALGFLQGTADGDFGPGTEQAVEAFQTAKSPPPNGVVDASTWAALFPENPVMPDPPIFGKPLNFRCLALTGRFETSSLFPESFSGLAGDFDGMGISFGALQWNLGQATLQGLLSQMNLDHPDVLQGVFADGYAELLTMLGQSVDEQLTWARSKQNARFMLSDPWKTRFISLGQTDEFQAIELASAAHYFATGMDLVQEYGLSSERAAALMFDLAVQNGSIRPATKALILRDFAALDPGLSANDKEVAKMRIIANRRAEAANAVEDVRTRKLAIANGTGVVHGGQYDLAAQFDLTLDPIGLSNSASSSG